MNKKLKKNYIILSLIFIIVVLLMIYLKMWSNIYKEKKYSTSIFKTKVEECTLDELPTVMTEMSNLIIYVGNTSNKTTYETEKKIFNYFEEKNLLNELIYIDVTNDKDYQEKLSNIFNNITIKTSPLIIYTKNKEAYKVINNHNGLIYTYELD